MHEKIGSDAEILERISRNLGKAHLQENLLTAANREQILDTAGRISLRDFCDLMEVVAARDMARQRECVTSRLDIDVFFRHQFVDTPLQPDDVVSYSYIDDRDHMPRSIGEGKIGRAKFLSVHDR